MTNHDFSNDVTNMTAVEEVLRIERTFAAPQALVWEVMTTPEHLANWVGPHGTSTEVTEWDFQVGGKWRWVNAFDGGEVAFRGAFVEISAPAKLVRTEMMDGDPFGEDAPATETLTFEARDASTHVVWLTLFPSAEVLAMAIENGMAVGALEQMDRIAALVEGPAK
jgi:uncharacterized protein YndB with AHSA1/START domain